MKRSGSILIEFKFSRSNERTNDQTTDKNLKFMIILPLEMFTRPLHFTLTMARAASTLKLFEAFFFNWRYLTMSINVALNKSSYHQATVETMEDEKNYKMFDIVKMMFFLFLLWRLHVMVAKGFKIHPSEFMTRWKKRIFFRLFIVIIAWRSRFAGNLGREGLFDSFPAGDEFHFARLKHDILSMLQCQIKKFILQETFCKNFNLCLEKNFELIFSLGSFQCSLFQENLSEF